MTKPVGRRKRLCLNRMATRCKGGANPKHLIGAPPLTQTSWKHVHNTQRRA